MKSTALKPHERKKQNYALKAFLWGVIISAVFIVPSMIIDKGMFIYYGDYNVQVLPFYQLMSDSIKHGELGWNWYTDLGTAFVGGYSFYNLGSPFFWMLVPFPVDWIPYLMGPMTILKFGLSSLTAYVFLRRYAKDKNNAVMGAMLYAFSGFALYSMVFHFIDSMVFFPLLLAALDGYIYDNKRGRFALMAAVCGIVNYYFFIAEAVFCFVYWVVRMAAKSYRLPARNAVYLFFEAFVGVGMATFILLPSLYHIIGNTRVSGSAMDGLNFWFYDSSAQYAEILLSFFVPPEHPGIDVYVEDFDSKWKSINAFLPLFGMSGVFAIIFNKRKNKWLRIFYGVCAVMMLVPVLNSSFQLFRDTVYVRWFFMLLLIMSLGSVMALEDPSTKWKKAIGWNTAITALIILILGFTPTTIEKGEREVLHIGLAGATIYFWLYAAVALVNIVLCVLLVKAYKKNRSVFSRYCALFTSLAIVFTMASQFITCKIEGEESINVVKDNLLNYGDNINIDDIQQWRSDVVTTSNYSMIMYDSDHIASMDYPDLEAIVAKQNETITSNPENKIYWDDDNLNVFWRIPGFESFHSTVSGSVTEFFNGLDYTRTTLSNWPMGMYGLHSLMSVKYMFNHEDTSLYFEFGAGQPIMPGWKYLDTQNGYDIYENEYVLPMGLAFDHFMTDTEFAEIPTQYKHLVLLDALVTSSFDSMFEFAGVGMVQVDEDKYDFTTDEYYKFCEERSKNACYDFTRDNKGFEAKIDTGGKERYVMFTVPFDNGWKAFVNGEKTDIVQVDNGFMAVKVPANMTSTIRFDYHIPGIFYGTFVAVLSLFLLIVYLAAAKIQSAPVEEGNTAEKQDDKNKVSEISDGDGSADSDNSNSENSGETEDEDISIFDIVKQTEEETMMHVYSRVPVVLESGSGAAAYDIDYKKYIDFTSGIGVNALGFANGAWSDAVEKQMNKVQHTSNIYYNTTQIQLAELLCIKTGFSKVFFANSGAEANECAIKIARKYGSDKYGQTHTHIVTLENSFHGRTITTLSATGQDVFHKYFTPFTEGFSYAKPNDMQSIKDKVTKDTCAVMIELIQGEGGVNPLDKDFVTELSKFCEENDLLLIVDEIQTGIGRTGKLFCYENYGITPDVITSAKALGGGLPLSACLCSDKLKDVMTVGTNGTTFGGNPIACAGAMKIINTVADEEFLEDVVSKGEYIMNRIKSMNGVKEVRGMGLMIGIALEKDNAKEIQRKCAENGLLVLTAKNLIRLLPPLNIEYIDIDDGLDILEKTISESLGGEDKND